MYINVSQFQLKWPTTERIELYKKKNGMELTITCPCLNIGMGSNTANEQLYVTFLFKPKKINQIDRI